MNMNSSSKSTLAQRTVLMHTRMREQSIKTKSASHVLKRAAHVRKRYFSMILILAFCAPLPAADKQTAKLVSEANKSLTSGQIDKALDTYKQLEEKIPDTPELAYNQAIAHYRKQEYEKATELFTKALATREPSLEAKTKFNLGNCAYATALQKQDNIEEAIDNLKVAVRYFQEALDLDPADKDARVNIEMAELLTKHLRDKQKQQQEQQKEQEKEDKKKDEEKKDEQKEQPSSQPTSQPQSQPASQPQSQPASQPSQQKQQQDGDEKQEQKQPPGQQQKQEQAQQDPNSEQKAQPVPMEIQLSKEEAERLLQLIRDKEKQRREDQKAQQIPIIEVPVDKDW